MCWIEQSDGIEAVVRTANGKLNSDTWNDSAPTTPRINLENFEGQLESCQIRNGGCDRRLSFQSRRLNETARCRGRRDVRGEVDRYQDCVVIDSCVQTRDDAVLGVCVGYRCH